VGLVPGRSYGGQFPRFDITVAGGTVTVANLVQAGSGLIATDTITTNAAVSGTPAGLLAGTGFLITVNTVTTNAFNTVLGRGAMQGNPNGGSNTVIGFQAGRPASLPSGGTASYNRNVFIGFQAGANETNSDRLYISNTNTATPLIYGEFDNTGGNAGRVKLNANSFEILSNPPATAASTGNAGQFTWDSDYIYICVATNTWKRVAIATF